jgi:cbb3-type cytochrome oxidase subunit 3
VTPSSPQNPLLTASTIPGTLPEDTGSVIVLDSQESNIFTPDPSSVLEDVNTSSTQTPDSSSSIAPSKEISTGAIVGISILVFFLSLGLVAAFYFLYYKRRSGTAAKSKVSGLPFAGESLYSRRFKTPFSMDAASKSKVSAQLPYSVESWPK